MKDLKTVYGAVGDGVTDDTTAITTAFAETDETIFVPSGTYKCSGDIFINAKIIGSQGAVFNIATTGSNRGFVINAGGHFEGCTINRTVTSPGANARDNCVLYIGPDDSTSDTAYNHIVVRDMILNALGAESDECNAFAVYNNSSDIIIENVEVNGEFDQGFLAHWGWKNTPDTSNHTRRISINRMAINGVNGVGNGFVMTGMHDIDISGLFVKDTQYGIIVGAGDNGGYEEIAESNRRTMGGINFTNVTLQNIKNKALQFNGKSYILDGGPKRWISANYPGSGINFNGLTIARGALGSDVGVHILHYKNVNISGLNIFNQDTANIDSTSPAIEIIGGVNVNIQGSVETAVVSNSVLGKNIKLDINAKSPVTDYSPSLAAHYVRGASVTATVDGAVALNATSIRLDALTCDIYAGMLFSVGANTYEFTENWYYNPSVSAENLSPVIGIKPAIAAIADNAVITQYKGPSNVVITGNLDHYNDGVYIDSDHASCVRNVNIASTTFKDINQNFTIANATNVKTPDNGSVTESTSTFTPSLINVTASYTSRAGRVNQIGKKVHAEIEMVISSLDTTDNSSFEIGLPVAPANRSFAVVNIDYVQSTIFSFAATDTYEALVFSGADRIRIANRAKSYLAYNTAGKLNTSGTLKMTIEYLTS